MCYLLRCLTLMVLVVAVTNAAPSTKVRERTRHDFWLVRTDAHGDMLWWKSYSNAFEMHCQAAVATCNGGFALAGVADGCVFAGSWGLWLVVTNEAGDVQWDRCYYPVPGSFINWDVSLLQLSDGRLVMSGSAHDPNRIWLMCLTETGDELWCRNYDMRATREFGLQCQCLSQFPDGGFVLAGLLDTHGWITRTDGDGRQLWFHTYGDEFWNMFNGVTTTPDGRIIAVGERGGWVVITDSTGNVLREQMLGKRYGTRFRSIQVEPDGGFVLGGVIHYPDSGEYFLLMRINEAGDSMWSRHYGEGKEAYCSAFVADGSGYVLAGATFADSDQGSNGLGVKTDICGDVEWSLTLGCAGLDQFRIAGAVPGGYFFVGNLNQPCNPDSI
jgi:hypothetical protein